MDAKKAAELVRVLNQGKRIANEDIVELDLQCRDVSGFMKLVANEAGFASRDSVRMVIDRALKKYGRDVRRANG